MENAATTTTRRIHCQPGFITTRWSVVIRAGGETTPDSTSALESLCQAYWYPLYAFVRASGNSPDDAVDLTQEFFARLLEKKWLAHADQARGRFRTFLLAAMKNFLTNEWHRSQRQKRGGGAEIIALDALKAEERFALEPRHNVTPEAIFERHWALTILQRAHDRLAHEAAATGGKEKFDALEPALTGERTEEGYETIANRFATTANAVKSWVLRMRRRYGEILREEVTETLLPGEDVDEELHRLLAIVSDANV
jgi:RNA polymerase sigma-70 factor (ECF subfamily)